MSRMKNFAMALEDLGIDPEAWAKARAAEGDTERHEFFLAKDVEELVEAAEFDRVICLMSGENIIDVYAMVCLAASTWPLKKGETALSA